ncbi:hypothetical protein CRUP_002221 [Coryphaenoides rupestris]|nr:hypothetical protein CRUP_002221 [Coryphaenoides rupestris]
MGELEGSYRALQTPATRLGAPFNAGISTLEPGQCLSANMSAAAAGNAAAAAGRNYSRGLQMRVVGLDDSQEFYDMENKSLGQTLLSEVFQRGNLIESDYFGLEFQNMQMNWVWLEPIKPIVRQVRRPANTLFRLSVKFFPPDPGQIQEEYTRYLFSLQMKRDLMESRLLCTENTGALLASHLVQSEIGDFEELADRDYLRLNTLLPYQERVQDRIMDFHRRHLGQTPAESDFQVLEIARKLEMYGVRFHPASDREGTKINLSVAHMGLQVFQGNTKINTFNWSKIRKLSFKRKRFLIKLHPEVHDTLEFLMGSRDQCKIFWKNCVEHHSGRTQKQLVDYVRDSGTKRTPYQRRNSKVRMSGRSLAYDMPKLNLSFNDSLRAPGPMGSLSSPLSYQHPLLLSSSLSRSPQQTPLSLLGQSPAALPPLEPRLRSPQTHGATRPSSPPRDDPAQTAAAASPSSHCAFQGTVVDSPQLSPFSLQGPLCTCRRSACQATPPAPPQPRQPDGQLAPRLEEDEEGRRKWFRSAVIKENALPEGLKTLLFSNIDPIYEFHRGFLREGVPPMATEGDEPEEFGDVMLGTMSVSKALKEVAEIAAQLQSSLIRLENFQKLTELQRDLVGVENLTSPGRVSVMTGRRHKRALKNRGRHLYLTG